VDPQSRNHIFEERAVTQRERGDEHHLHQPLWKGSTAVQPVAIVDSGRSLRSTDDQEPDRELGGGVIRVGVPQGEAPSFWRRSQRSSRQGSNTRVAGRAATLA